MILTKTFQQHCENVCFVSARLFFTMAGTGLKPVGLFACPHFILVGGVCLFCSGVLIELLTVQRLETRRRLRLPRRSEVTSAPSRSAGRAALLLPGRWKRARLQAQPAFSLPL